MKLFDVDSPLVDVPEEGLHAGMIGTVVEISSDGCEVEFCDDDGRTVALVGLPRENLAPIKGQSSAPAGNPQR